MTTSVRTTPLAASRPIVEIDALRESRRSANETCKTLRRLGAGRSAEVFLMENARGRRFARKIFGGEALATLVHLVLSGAPNPYAWSRTVLEAAACRRRILDALVTFWFEDRLRTPGFYAHDFADGEDSPRIDMEVITGRAASLAHPFTRSANSELRDLRAVMRELQQHLRDSGFDGLVWQAGLANPVAAGNFLLDSTQQRRAWVWIDLESGVPALFPINPIKLLTFYLTKSWRHRAPLFDHVDTKRLRAWLGENESALTARFGAHRFAQIARDCRAIGLLQQTWKNTSRTKRSVTWAERTGIISKEQAHWYRRRPLRWQAKLAGRTLRKMPSLAAKVVSKVRERLLPVPLRMMLLSLGRFFISGKFRRRLAAYLVMKRIRAWRRRGQFTKAEAKRLVGHVRSDEATAYLTDFGMHLAIKVPVKLFEWGVVPALFAWGLLTRNQVLLCLALAGPIVRSSYTIGRSIQASMRGREIPWAALVVGALPVVGNAAYPVQILYTSTDSDHDVARFILYDMFATVGRILPIWGGRDTLTEHFFNRIPHLWLRRLARKSKRRAA